MQGPYGDLLDDPAVCSNCLRRIRVERADAEQGLGREQVEHSIEKLRRNGVVYEPATDYLKFVGWA